MCGRRVVVYGDARADARHLISQIIKKYQRDHDSDELAQFATECWAAMSAAAVMRAAPELHRLSQLDRPASLPLDTLNYATAREITSTLSLCGTDDTHIISTDMGTVPHLQPSLLIDDGTFEEMTEDEEALDANRDTIPSPQQEHYGSRPTSGDSPDRARRWDDDFIDS